MLSLILVAHGLVVPTAPLALHGACMSPVVTRAAAPVAVVPPTRSVPVVIGFAGGSINVGFNGAFAVQMCEATDQGCTGTGMLANLSTGDKAKAEIDGELASSL